SQLAGILGRTVECTSLEPANDKAGTAAIAGLKRGVEGKQEFPFLTLSTGEPETTVSMASPEIRKWAMMAGALFLVCLILPYAESLILKPRLAKKLADVNAARGQLEVIDRELEFFQSLKTNQPPYLDALFVMADSSPQGSRLETLSMNRRGEVSLRGSMRDADQVAQFRSKLIGSGFFSSVVVEEQAPTPDRQKVNLRITAQWKMLNARENLKLGPTAAEMEKIKAMAKELAGVVPGGGMPPPGFPPQGISMPPTIRPSGGPMPSGLSTNSSRSRVVPSGSQTLPPGVIIRSGPQ
ncbi:MAG: hypothetical protein JWM04_1715, partial [Verrucomicrobiales bacterium]|nr:hypothetical protein [Verrucomicrobiales bacterium]